MDELNILRTFALLHDLGKLKCWANAQPLTESNRFTFEIIKNNFGEEFACSYMPSYCREADAKSNFEKIVHLADCLSSGCIESEEPMEPCRATLPFHFTRILSKEIQKIDAATLASTIREVEKELEIIGKTAKQFSFETYQRIYTSLAHSSLRDIPADTKETMNDISLWQHLKLTAAFSTCIWLDGGYKNDEPEKYSFALLSGDADKVFSYIKQSIRLPDLRARSRRIKDATKAAALSIEKNLGPECLIFYGGGSILALCPHSDEIIQRVESVAQKEFEDATQNQVQITFNSKIEDGAAIQMKFGEIWDAAVEGMRLRKLDRSISMSHSTLAEGVMACDVCRIREAAIKDKRKPLPLNPPRFETLCDICWQLREEGKGFWLDNIRKNTDFVAIVKVDGDDMGRVLSGEKFKGVKKTITACRLAELSSLVHRTCEEELAQIVEKDEGEVVFAGGDDLLAVLPGERALFTTRNMAYKFADRMGGKCTMSAGVAIMNYKLPIYVGLETAEHLISLAKKNEGKNSVAFAIIGSTGVTSTELERNVKPYKWNQLDVLLGLVGSLESSEVASVQIRKIATYAQRSPELADAYVKQLMGKRLIRWREGEEYMSHLESGFLFDAFLLFNAFKSRKEEK
jgi:hypothetical protein